jgi:hypothetical protein
MRRLSTAWTAIRTVWLACCFLTLATKLFTFDGKPEGDLAVASIVLTSHSLQAFSPA